MRYLFLSKERKLLLPPTNSTEEPNILTNELNSAVRQLAEVPGEFLAANFPSFPHICGSFPHISSFVIQV